MVDYNSQIENCASYRSREIRLYYISLHGNKQEVIKAWTVYTAYLKFYQELKPL